MSTKKTGAYTVAGREDAIDFMAGYSGYGEQRWYGDSLGTEQVSFSWRRMPPGTGDAAATATGTRPGGGLLRDLRNGDVQGRRRGL